MKKICLLSASLMSLLLACGGSSKDPTQNDGGTDYPLPDSGVGVVSKDGGVVVSPDGGDGGDGGVDSGDGGGVNPCAGGVCQVGEACKAMSDCESGACDYTGKCLAVEDRACIYQYGGSTCGTGEVADPTHQHESCCKALPVTGYNHVLHPGKTVMLGKFEVSAGMFRAFVDYVTAQEGGKPNFKDWVKKNRPSLWTDSWDQYLPSDYIGSAADQLTIPRLDLGDPRWDGATPGTTGPGIIIPPKTDQVIDVGFNHQFGGTVFLDTHGNDCGTFSGAYGFPTWYYTDDVMAANGEVPRADQVDPNTGVALKAKDLLDSRSMNCGTGLIYDLFCSYMYPGGELASSEVLEYVTQTPATWGTTTAACGIQHDNHADILSNIFTSSVWSGGICPDAYSGLINNTWDSGDDLPVPGSIVNKHYYGYPDSLTNSTSDKSWQISPSGRMIGDRIKLAGNTEPFVDLAGNLTEKSMATVHDVWNGKLGDRFRSIGSGSQHSDLNNTDIDGTGVLRVERGQSKSAMVGFRCQYYK